MTEWLAGNWFWVLLIVLFVGMHAFGGGCGMGHGRRAKGETSEDGKEGKGEKGGSCH